MQFSSIKSKSFIVIVAICTFLCHWTAFGCGEGVFMKEIFLGGRHGSVVGNYAIIDDDDYEKISEYRWTAWRHRNTIYAVSGGGMIKIHRVILGVDYRNVFVDHIDGNGLNNQKTNLRLCTNKENIRNSKIQTNNTTGFKGVSYHKQTGKYRARIKVSGKEVHIGLYDTSMEAADNYNKMALACFGVFARLNKLNSNQ